MLLIHKQHLRNAAIVLLSAILGCTKSDTVAVTGTVTLDGQPVPDAEVMFNPLPNKPGRMASTHTDSSGHFTLETFKPGDGAMPGDYVVTLAEYFPPGKAPTPPPGGGPLPSRFPVKYGNPDQSPLHVTIERGKKNDFPLEAKK
jgi:hypothetical protein